MIYGPGQSFACILRDVELYHENQGIEQGSIVRDDRHWKALME